MQTSHPYKRTINLADARLGTQAIFVTDDWFADVNRMLQPEPPVWKEGVFDDNGKWMDGWESRRKRFEGYDHAIIRLGVPGFIRGWISILRILPVTIRLRPHLKPVFVPKVTPLRKRIGHLFCQP